MHPCLTIVEVQDAIFRQVRSDGLRTSMTPNVMLARLARTCRTFSDVALNVLWEDLDSILHLIQCLPRTLWRMESSMTSIRGRLIELITFQRAMSLSDWEIFRGYAARVRSLSTLERLGDIRLDKSIILALTHPPFDGPLIPHLKILHWRGSDLNKNYTPLLPVLFTRMLADVMLPSFFLQSPEIPAQLITTCLVLENLRIEGEETYGLEPRNPDDQRTLSKTITCLHSLKSLECSLCTLDEAAIIHLSRLPSLTKLVLDLQNGLHLETLRRGLIPSAFASLQSLSLQVGALSTLTSLLQAIHFKGRQISFRVDEIPSPDGFLCFFSALVDGCDPMQLSEITLAAADDNWLVGGERDEVSLSTFQPLLALPKIERFDFDAMCSFSFDDNAIKILSDSWPNLSTLSLNFSFGWGIKSRVTHRGLITLLSRCAALDYLALEVDFTEIDQPLSGVPSSYGITNPCERVNFLSSAIHHPPAITAFLNDVCPRLLSVTSLRIEDTDDEFLYEERWAEVNGQLWAGLARSKEI